MLKKLQIKKTLSIDCLLTRVEMSFSDLYERLMDNQISEIETIRKLRGSIDIQIDYKEYIKNLKQ